MPSKRFGCSAANRRKIASVSAASTFNTKRWAAWSAGYMSFFWSTDTRPSGGSSDTDATELAVIPTGRPAGSRVVRTVTPVAKRPSSWRNCAGSTPGMSSPQELGQDARGKHTARRDDVPGRAHQKIREVGPRRQAAYDAVGERGPSDAHPDEPLEQPLPGEFAPARARVGRQHRGGERAPVLTPYPPLPLGDGELWTCPLSGTERGTGGEDGDEAFGGQLRPPQRGVDSLARERVEEVGGVAHQQGTAPGRDCRA